MRPAVLVRIARDLADDGEIARIVSAAYPDWPRTGAEIAAARARRGDRFHLTMVAETDERVAALGFIEVPDVAAVPGRLRARVTADPAHLGAGIGATLYQALEAEARRRGARELVSEALESHPRARRFASDRGYAIYNSRVESRLRLADLHPEGIGRAIEQQVDRFFASGLRIASYRQLAAAYGDAPQRLYRLFTELWRDVPFGISGADPSYATYLAEEVGDPAFRADGSFVALDGTDWVAMCTQSALGRSLLTSMTGVTRRQRRRGLARWLKLHSIRYALEAGAEQMRTFNDAANEGMIALNRELGFVPAETGLRLKKELR